MTVLVEGLSNDSLVYEVVQRTYRNAILDYVRFGLREFLSGDDLDAAIRNLFQREWESITISAAQAEATGVTERSPVDALDHLSVGHFRTLFEKHWTELAPESIQATPEFAKKVRKELLLNMDAVVGLRNPISHPPKDSLPVLDAIRCLDAARRTLRTLGMTDATAATQPFIDELIARAASGQAIRKVNDEQIEANLPARETVVVDFVGRNNELKQLWEWLLDDDSRRWMLVGDGGKGKSATAFRFARDVRDGAPRPLTVVHWLSAKRRRFEEGDVVAIDSPDFWDLDSAINWLLRGYGWVELAEQPLPVKKESLLNLLDEFPALVILDDLDSLPPDADDVSEFFLLDVCSTRSKVLVTSRRTYTGMGRSKTVIEGLDPKDAKAFLESRQVLMGLEDVNLTRSRLDRVFEATERSPLYMEDLLRHARFYPIDQAIDVWKTNKGDRAREYALQREIEILSPAARRVLEICAMAPSAATIDELARCSRLPEDEIIQAIDELHAMYLVPGPQIVEEVPRYALNRNAAHLLRGLLRQSARHDEVRNAVQAVFGDVARASAGTATSDICRQAQVFLRGGEPERARNLIEQALRDQPNRPELYAMRGRVALSGQSPSGAEARDAFKRAHELRSKDPSMYQLWCQLELDSKEWGLAAEAAEAGLGEIKHENPRLLRMAGYARSRLARQMKNAFATERAKQEARAADKLLDRAVRSVSEGSVPGHDISLTYRAWVLNADLLGALDAQPVKSRSLCARLQQWVSRYPEDQRAANEVERFRDRCPDLA